MSTDSSCAGASDDTENESVMPRRKKTLTRQRKPENLQPEKDAPRSTKSKDESHQEDTSDDPESDISHEDMCTSFSMDVATGRMFIQGTNEYKATQPLRERVAALEYDIDDAQQELEKAKEDLQKRTEGKVTGDLVNFTSAMLSAQGVLDNHKCNLAKLEQRLSDTIQGFTDEVCTHVKFHFS
jgi:hypothetical protein